MDRIALVTGASSGIGEATVRRLIADGYIVYAAARRTDRMAMLTVAGEFLEDPYPAWTAVGVMELFEPEALVEVSCEAVLHPTRRPPN